MQPLHAPTLTQAKPQELESPTAQCTRMSELAGLLLEAPVPMA